MKVLVVAQYFPPDMGGGGQAPVVFGCAWGCFLAGWSGVWSLDAANLRLGTSHSD